MKKSYLTILTLIGFFAAISACRDSRRTPFPTPSPVPTASPTPRTDITASCLAVTNGSGGTCSQPGPRQFANDILLAIESAKDAHLENYNVRTNTVVDIGLFLKDVAEALDARGLCGVPTGSGKGKARIFVRDSSDSSETYNVIENGVQVTLTASISEGCSPAEPFPQTYSSVTKETFIEPHIDGKFVSSCVADIVPGYHPTEQCYLEKSTFGPTVLVGSRAFCWYKGFRDAISETISKYRYNVYSIAFSKESTPESQPQTTLYASPYLESVVCGN